MNYKRAGIALLCAASMGSMPAIAAETHKGSGTVCWTGEIEYLGTSKKDMAWSWSVDYVYVADDRDPEKAGSGRCFGSGGLVDGKPESSAEFCLNRAKDGSTRMSRAISGAKDSQGIYFGGTGKYAGISGGYTGGPRIAAPADEGRLAGCRHVQGEYSVEAE